MVVTWDESAAREYLRPYQSDVIDRASAKMARGARKLIIQAATGAGKTVVMAYLVLRAYRKGKRVVIIAHRRKLISQISEALDLFGVPHGVIMAGEGRNHALVQVCSRDTLLARGHLPPADLLIVDEAHNLMGDGYLTLAQRWPLAFVIGFTATPARSNGKGLGAYFDDMVCAVGMRQLIDDGFLCPVRIYSAHKLGESKRKGKKVKGLAGNPVAHWLLHGENRPTILFAQNVASSQACMMEFVQAGIPAEHVDAKTPDKDRDATIDRIITGKTLVVCNSALWTEGVDIPELSCMINYRTMASIVLWLQALGRIMRKVKRLPNKKDAVCIDHSGAIFLHGFPDEMPEWSLNENETVDQRRKKKAKEGGTAEQIQCPQCAMMFSGRSICPSCGHVLRRKAKAAAAEDELLAEVARSGQGDVQQHETMQRQWMRFLFIARSRGQPVRVAAGMFKGKFKVNVTEAGVSPLPERDQWYQPVADVFPSLGQRR